MSDEGRRVFKTETILALMSGKGGNGVSDLLGYLTGRELSAREEDIVGPLCRAWVCSQHPPFLASVPGDADVYGDWAAKEAKKHGENVSITPIPAADAGPVVAVLNTLAENTAAIAAQAEEIEGLKGQVEELTPFKAQAADLENKVADLEGQVETLQGEKAELAKATAEFEGKVPVAEAELTSTVKGIVEQAVKDAIKSMPVPAAGGAPAAEGEAVAEAPAEEAGGGVPDTFGFGASGDDADGFGF